MHPYEYACRCRLCMMAHLYDHADPRLVQQLVQLEGASGGQVSRGWEPSAAHSRGSRIEDVNRWWRGDNVCIGNRWRDLTGDRAKFATD